MRLSNSEITDLETIKLQNLDAHSVMLASNVSRMVFKRTRTRISLTNKEAIVLLGKAVQDINEPILTALFRRLVKMLKDRAMAHQPVPTQSSNGFIKSIYHRINTLSTTIRTHDV